MRFSTGILRTSVSVASLQFNRGSIKNGFGITLIFATSTHCLPPTLIAFGCFVNSCRRKNRVRRNGSRQLCEEEMLEQKFEELSNQMGHLVLDILLISLKKVVRENGIFSDISEARSDARDRNREEPY